MRLNRIRKLFALATDQEGTPEGEAASRVARRLMHAHDVELSSLSPLERDEADPFAHRELLLGGSEQWRCRLLSVVARHCECVASWRAAAGCGSLYGRNSSVEVGEYLYILISRDLTRARAMRRMELTELPEARRASLLNDYCQSAVLAVEIRCTELRAAEPEDCTALIRSRPVGLWTWMQEQGHELRAEPPFGYTLDRDGWREGHRLKLLASLRG